MRAKRSKKYRKLMHQYELTFNFREPYQVLVDSNFLSNVDAFKMDLLPALERTLQGKPKPCHAHKMLAQRHFESPTYQSQDSTAVSPAPSPHPTELPLRHCSHNADSTPIDEVECLLSLLSPSTEVKKNKDHYILATADPIIKKNDKNDGQRKRKTEEEREAERAMRRAKALRVQARSIPGVPIIYVKRSVMVLEPMSTPSENIRDGVERGKFRAGLDDPSLGKRKREDEAEPLVKIPGLKKAKGPNPLSVKKAKKTQPASSTPKKQKPQTADTSEKQDGEESGEAKTKRRRRHAKGPREGDADVSAEAGSVMEVDA
ncbi:rRNA processing protein [Penicillium maclennaniae]|uniref:rRNA processing protein n=1 Tax=Penicillium maclennaniae TaxID=1343394 RepID=UPI00253FE937|nr:rRNA processing protein [Penicillium maclennaniae]KAJ5670721.1 rRNA processing protein [Penicillium maclennaniae]